MQASMDSFVPVDWSALRENVFRDGGVVLKEFLQRHALLAIAAEIEPWIRQINFNEIMGSSIIGNNRWIFHLGLASRTAVNLALDERVLDMMESIFGEPAILAEFSFQEKVESSTDCLKMHSDRAGGIMIFYYISGVDGEHGSTRFIPGTHQQGDRFPSRNPPFVDDEAVAQRAKDIIATEGGPGTTLIFDQDIWHDLPPVKRPGRKCIWCLYQPASRASCAVDHLYRQSNLADLNPRQLKAFGVGMAPFARAGYLRFVGSRLNKTHVRLAMRYFRKFRHIGRPEPLVKDFSAMPARIRAPH
jgi:hypothetical protein